MCFMAKKKYLSYEEKLIEALRKLPIPLEDKKHNIVIYFSDDRARSNQSRFQHIAMTTHELRPSDIERIPKHINNSKIKKDKTRADTFNVYIKRNNYNDEYIKMSLKISDLKDRTAYVKTIFITKRYKVY